MPRSSSCSAARSPTSDGYLAMPDRCVPAAGQPPPTRLKPTRLKWTGLKRTRLKRTRLKWTRLKPSPPRSGNRAYHRALGRLRMG